MVRKRSALFNPQTFLDKVGKGKTNLTVPRKHSIFSQGDAADALLR